MRVFLLCVCGPVSWPRGYLSSALHQIDRGLPLITEVTLGGPRSKYFNSPFVLVGEVGRCSHWMRCAWYRTRCEPWCIRPRFYWMFFSLGSSHQMRQASGTLMGQTWFTRIILCLGSVPVDATQFSLSFRFVEAAYTRKIPRIRPPFDAQK